MCRVCHRALSRWQDPAGIYYWNHLAPPDGESHPADPITLDRAKVIYVCDFCCQDLTGVRIWTYFSEPFGIRLAGPFGGFDFHENELWAACRDCHELIETDEWNKLAMRSVRNQIQPDYPVHLRPELFQTVADFHQLFARGRVGDAIEDVEE